MTHALGESELGLAFREFLGLLLRSWVMVVAAVSIAAIGTVVLVRDGGVFTSRTLVVFTVPGAGTVARYNGNDSSSVITFAESVATQVNAGRTDTQYYSLIDAPIYGAGLREAVVVTVEDKGSQWVSNVDSAVIEVQIVGRTEDWVRNQQETMLAEIEGVAESQQRLMSIPENERMGAHVEPLTTAIDHVTPSRSAQAAAFLAMTVAAFIIGAGGAWLLDRRRRGARGSASSLQRLQSRENVS